MRPSCYVAFVVAGIATFPVAASAQGSETTRDAVAPSSSSSRAVSSTTSGPEYDAFRRAEHAIDDQRSGATVVYALSAVLVIAGIATIVGSWIGNLCFTFLGPDPSCDARNRAAALGEGIGGAIAALGVLAFALGVGVEVDARHRRTALEQPMLSMALGPSLGGAVLALRVTF